MKILITGAAGFIGFHLARRLLNDGCEVVGIDSLNDYYDVALKFARLSELGVEEQSVSWNQMAQSSTYSGFRFVRMHLEDRAELPALFEREKFDRVVNLAAQAGVRYSLENPFAYVDSNLTGFVNLLECCRRYPVEHLVYASSSSVYGGNTKTPFAESDAVEQPVSLYAATKRANELMAYTYSHLYKLSTTGLRFFTVYGPWGRPDMAPMLFSKAITEGNTIRVFNEGNLSRDFTYIDDIIEGVVRILAVQPEADDRGVRAELYNIGCGHPVKLMDFIHTLETALGKKAELEFVPMQPGDVYTTYADTTKLATKINYQPHTLLPDGIHRFVEWYKYMQKSL